MKHIICYSGGHSSALVAINVAAKYGASNVILLNHDINGWVESADIKRFKVEIANYLGVPITFANIGDLPADELPDQFDVVMQARAFKVGSGTELCTSRLKTEPFMKWLKQNHPNKDCVIYYGFDDDEMHRVERRQRILDEQGYKSDYPLALWADEDLVCYETKDIGIEPPNQYESFKHANCIGCLKAGKQHWYIVYCTRPDVWEKAKLAEQSIGYTIIRDASLERMEPIFKDMKAQGIPATEHIPAARFWSQVRKVGIQTDTDRDHKPCDCLF